MKSLHRAPLNLEKSFPRRLVETSCFARWLHRRAQKRKVKKWENFVEDSCWKILLFRKEKARKLLRLHNLYRERYYSIRVEHEKKLQKNVQAISHPVPRFSIKQTFAFTVSETQKSWNLRAQALALISQHNVHEHHISTQPESDTCSFLFTLSWQHAQMP